MYGEGGTAKGKTKRKSRGGVGLGVMKRGKEGSKLTRICWEEVRMRMKKGRDKMK